MVDRNGIKVGGKLACGWYFDHISDCIEEEGKGVCDIDTGEEAEEDRVAVKGHKGSYSESIVEEEGDMG